MASILEKAKEAVLGPEKKEEEKVELPIQKPQEKAPEPEEDLGALAEETHEEPDRRKDYELDEIAEQFDIPDVEDYVKLYEEDLVMWKKQTDQAAFIKIKSLEDQMARLHMFSDKDEKEDFMQRAHHHAELIVRFNETDLKDSDAVREWKAQVREAHGSASAMLNASENYNEVMDEYLCTLQAYRCALEFYEEARDELMAQLEEDNATMVKVSKIKTVANVLKEIADAYEPVEDDDTQG